jgi:hypothetical protein
MGEEAAGFGESLRNAWSRRASLSDGTAGVVASKAEAASARTADEGEARV